MYRHRPPDPAGLASVRRRPSARSAAPPRRLRLHPPPCETRARASASRPRQCWGQGLPHPRLAGGGGRRRGMVSVDGVRAGQAAEGAWRAAADPERGRALFTFPPPPFGS
ncbi:hypothetical protein SEVIR_5G341750v4 [Setaria viridis]